MVGGSSGGFFGPTIGGTGGTVGTGGTGGVLFSVVEPCSKTDGCVVVVVVVVVRVVRIMVLVLCIVPWFCLFLRGRNIVVVAVETVTRGTARIFTCTGSMVPFAKGV